MGRGVGITYCGCGVNQREAEMMGRQRYDVGGQVDWTRGQISGGRIKRERLDEDENGGRRQTDTDARYRTTTTIGTMGRRYSETMETTRQWKQVQTRKIFRAKRDTLIH